MEKQPSIYIMANKYNGTIYVGVTSNLLKRVWQHKQGSIQGFTAKYALKQLVYFEVFEDMENAIVREKQLKAGSRERKVGLIESTNPEWRDLYPEILG